MGLIYNGVVFYKIMNLKFLYQIEDEYFFLLIFNTKLIYADTDKVREKDEITNVMIIIFRKQVCAIRCLKTFIHVKKF